MVFVNAYIVIWFRVWAIDGVRVRLIQWFSTCRCLFTTSSLNCIPNRDWFVTYDWPNQNQATLFDSMTPSANGLNFIRSSSQSKILSKTV